MGKLLLWRRCATAALAATCLSWAVTVVLGVVHDEVVTLDPSNFQVELNDPNNPLWLLKFYAPWCGHCKQLAPILDRVAPKVAGKMAIGKIDCTVHKKLCDQYKISGYPTLKYSLDGGDVADYPFSRNEDSFIKFANKMSQPAVSIATSYETALEQLLVKPDEGADVKSHQQHQHGVIFVAYDPQVQSIGVYKNRPKPTLEQMLRKTDFTMAFEKVARKEQARANFAILSPASDCCKSFQSTDNTIPPVSAVADGDVAFVARLEVDVPPRIWQPPASTSNYASSLQDFVTDNSVPLVSQIGPDNFHKLGGRGRPLVLGVVHGDNPAQVERMKQILLDYCLKGPPEFVSKYYFGWIDGHLWQKFLEQFEIRVAELPQVFVLEVPKKRYWQNSTYSQQAQFGIQEFLEAIRDGKIASKVSSGPGAKGFWGVVHSLEDLFLDNLPWSILILLSFCVAFAVLVVPPPEDLRPPYSHQKNQAKRQHRTPSEQLQSTTNTSEVVDASDTAPETKKEK